MGHDRQTTTWRNIPRLSPFPIRYPTFSRSSKMDPNANISHPNATVSGNKQNSTARADSEYLEISAMVHNALRDYQTRPHAICHPSEENVYEFFV